MAFHLDSQTTTDVKPDMLSGVQMEMEFHMIDNICSIAHARTNRKDNVFLQRQLYIDEAHRALDIFR